MATTNITMRMDENLKSQLQELLSNIGMDMTTFFVMTAKQAIREQGLPFQPTLEVPNMETLKAFDCANVGMAFGGAKMPMIVEAEDSDFKAIVLPVAME